MTHNDLFRDSIRELEELYPVVSEEKKRAIDKAIESLKYCNAIENMGKLIGNTNYDTVPKSCYNCKYKDKLLTQEPCLTCNGHLSRWEGIDNGKS